MQINILTIFPNYFESSLDSSIIGRSQKTGLVNINIVNLRDFTTDDHHTTDDRPYGGGPGMVMLIEPIDKALNSLGAKKNTQNELIILTSAKGKLFNQEIAREHANLSQITYICGHYEGVDERVATHLVDTEMRIGDFVLTGGEPAVLTMLDATVRLIRGVVGNDLSTQGESHDEPGISGVPQYTRPADYNGLLVPDEIQSGNHKVIANWRNKQRHTL